MTLVSPSPLFTRGNLRVQDSHTRTSPRLNRVHRDLPLTRGNLRVLGSHTHTSARVNRQHHESEARA